MQANGSESDGTVNVSIIIPCYNQGIWLAEAVASALMQDLEGVEVIVVNDGSTDPVTRRMVEEIDDARVHVISTENQGLAAARNEGIQRAKGRYILPLDSDDRIHATYARKAFEILEQQQHIGIVYCRAELFGEEQGEWQLEPYDFPGILLSPQLFASAMFRKQDWEAVGGYQTDMIYGWEDYDFWLALIAKGVGVHRIDEILFYYRKTQGSMAGLDRKRMLYSFRKLFEHHRELYEANIDCLFEAVMDSKPERDRRSLQVRDAFEVYIPDAQGYAGRNIRSQRYAKGVWSRIAILLDRIPDAGIHLLRLDPSTSLGIVDIASVRLLHAGTGKPLFEAVEPSDFDAFTLGKRTHRLPHERFLRLFSETDDGHVFLPVLERSLLDQPLLLEVWLWQHRDLGVLGSLCEEHTSEQATQQRVAELLETVSQLKTSEQHLHEEVARQQAHAAELEKIVESAKARQERLRSESEQARMLAETLQSELRQERELRDQLQHKLGDAQQQIAALQDAAQRRRNWFRKG